MRIWNLEGIWSLCCREDVGKLSKDYLAIRQIAVKKSTLCWRQSRAEPGPARTQGPDYDVMRM
jgi:hypothetical protein